MELPKQGHFLNKSVSCCPFPGCLCQAHGWTEFPGTKCKSQSGNKQTNEKFKSDNLTLLVLKLLLDANFVLLLWIESNPLESMPDKAELRSTSGGKRPSPNTVCPKGRQKDSNWDQNYYCLSFIYTPAFSLPPGDPKFLRSFSSTLPSLQPCEVGSAGPRSPRGG